MSEEGKLPSTSVVLAVMTLIGEALRLIVTCPDESRLELVKPVPVMVKVSCVAPRVRLTLVMFAFDPSRLSTFLQVIMQIQKITVGIRINFFINAWLQKIRNRFSGQQFNV